VSEPAAAADGSSVGTGAVVVVGGTSGIGLRLAERYAARGRDVVITGRDAERAAACARGVGDRVAACALDLAEPHALGGRLAGIGAVDRLVLAAIERDENSARAYDIASALRLVTLKLVGYTEAVHALLGRLTADASILLFGGLALRRPYPGSTTVTTVNGGISGLVRTLAVELAPIRVNALHPGIVGDSPAWEGKPPAVLESVRARTPTGRLATMDDVAGAAEFLLENRAVNGVNLEIDGGWLLQ
jgi:NAD(P)-dependent dehydrogenase (short-subunit alcohol dehydrogenase family)